MSENFLSLGHQGDLDSHWKIINMILLLGIWIINFFVILSELRESTKHEEASKDTQKNQTPTCWRSPQSTENHWILSSTPAWTSSTASILQTKIHPNLKEQHDLWTKWQRWKTLKIGTSKIQCSKFILTQESRFSKNKRKFYLSKTAGHETVQPVHLFIRVDHPEVVNIAPMRTECRENVGKLYCVSFDLLIL